MTDEPKTKSKVVVNWAAENNLPVIDLEVDGYHPADLSSIDPILADSIDEFHPTDQISIDALKEVMKLMEANGGTGPVEVGSRDLHFADFKTAKKEQSYYKRYGGRGMAKSDLQRKIYRGVFKNIGTMPGRRATKVIHDDYYYPMYTFHPLEDHKISDEKDWKRTRFVSGKATPPSNSKRALLRAKRKKKK